MTCKSNHTHIYQCLSVHQKINETPTPLICSERSHSPERQLMTIYYLWIFHREPHSSLSGHSILPVIIFRLFSISWLMVRRTCWLKLAVTTMSGKYLLLCQSNPWKIELWSSNHSRGYYNNIIRESKQAGRMFLMLLKRLVWFVDTSPRCQDQLCFPLH